jgi:hypothetical protein
MITAEFEEKSYEGPLYNQLERGNPTIFTPGQVLENTLGFDRGLFLAHDALWETLGYKSPLKGAALAYYNWPEEYRPLQRRLQLPRFRLNLFLQAKRPVYHERKPRSLRSINGFNAPLWSFRITPHQQRLLELLTETLKVRAHVAYAAAAFHTYPDLFRHTKRRTVVQNSTFPPAKTLSGHTAWYYQVPGAQGAVNPDPERIEEPPLLDRLVRIARESEPYEAGDLGWLDLTARSVLAAVAETNEDSDGVTAHFFDDLQTLERIAERYRLESTLHSYVQLNLFTERFDLAWLVVADGA